MKIVFDLDHTLFRTGLFKKDLFEILYESGATENIVRETYKRHCKEDDGGAYDFDTHCLKITQKQRIFKKREAKDRYTRFIKEADFSKYVEIESFQYLKKWREMGAKLILLTKGGESIQWIKLKRTGMEEFFDEILICKHTKLKKIESLYLGKEDFFVNDLVSEILEVRREFPKVNCLLLNISDPSLESQNYSKIRDIPINTSIVSLEENIK